MKRALLIFLAIALIAVAPALSTKLPSFSAVTGTSMDPVLHQGYLLQYEKVAASEIKTGDIIIFTPPVSPEKRSTVPSLITHRVIEISGIPVNYRTRGDNNPVRDPWELSPDDVVGRVNLRISYLGFPVIFLQSPSGVILLTLLLLGSSLCLFSDELGISRRRLLVKVSSG